ITEAAWTAVREAVARTCSTTIAVDGEEDLLALPAVLYAAPDTVVVYGQRETGAVILDAGTTTGFVEDLVGRRTYNRVVVGGTWDRLHAGHRSLLLAAFERGGHVDIGVTNETYLGDEDDIQPYTERCDQLETMLEQYGLRGRATITPIDDERGTATNRGDAILVTEETVDGAHRINEDRTEMGKPPLDIITVPLVDAVDGDPISSSRIRNGEIDRDGRPVNS
ncbi:MAG: pantetheine-phosphate adenylyltransferase, partial [Candidatus Nanohaloarchaea archaeon]